MIPFAASAPLTFGLELELQIVDAATGRLSPSSMALWPTLQASTLARHYALEATLSTMEINSSVHVEADTLSREMHTLVSVLRAVAVAQGLDIRGGGTQLTQFWNDRRLAPTSRARELEERFGFLPKRFSTYGMHVHIGMTSGDEALRVGSVLQALVPVFIAMSAASPFMQLHDTGFCASRPLESLVYPHGGPLPRVADWAEFEGLVEGLYATRLAASLKDIYWDVRPKPEFGTVEVRVFDTPLSVDKAVAMAAFARACAALARAGTLRLAALVHPESTDRVSRFLACRDGLDAQLFDPFAQTWRPARDLLHDLFRLAARDPVCDEDRRCIDALEAHCAAVQDCERMRAGVARCQLLGAEPDAFAKRLPDYSASMCGLLLSPLAAIAGDRGGFHPVPPGVHRGRGLSEEEEGCRGHRRRQRRASEELERAD